MTALEEIRTYTDFLYGDETGVVYLANARPDDNGGIRWIRGFVNWPEDREALPTLLHDQALQGNEVYLCVSLLFRKPHKDERSLKHLFKSIQVAVLDFDGNAPDRWEELPPSMRVITSTSDRQHVYLKFTEPVTDIHLAENITRTLTYQFGSDLSGWDAVQVVRPPGTTNYGYAKPERNGQTYDVILEEHSPVLYSPASLPQTKDFRETVAKTIGNVPPLSEVLALTSIPDKLWELFSSDPQDKRRSDDMMRIAYMCAESGMTDEYIYAMLQDVDSRWLKYWKRTDRERRYLDFIERVRSKIPYNQKFEGLLGTTEEVRRNSFHFEELLELDVQIQWALEGLMTPSSYNFLVGDPGVGKTQLAVQLGINFSQNDNFLKFQNVYGESQKVLFISLELNPDQMAMLVKNIQVPIEIKNSFKFVFPDTNLDLNNEKSPGRQWLTKQIEDFKPKLVIIDALHMVVSASPSSDEEVAKVNSFLNGVRRIHETSLLVIHHPRKRTNLVSHRALPSLDDVYGSRFIAAVADLILFLHLTETGDLLLYELKNRFAEKHNPLHLSRVGVQFESLGEAVRNPEIKEMVIPIDTRKNVGRRGSTRRPSSSADELKF